MNSVPLALSELEPIQDGPLRMKPFERSERFVRLWWTGRAYLPNRRRRFFSAMRGGVEEARLEIDAAAHITGYLNAPTPAQGFVEIVFVEVAAQELHNGIGREVMGLIADAFPSRILAARSKEGVEGFWEKLTWERFSDDGGTPVAAPLFIRTMRS